MTWMSIDPALGGGNAVIVVEPTPDKLWVLDCRIDYNLKQTEQQIEIITGLARVYRPTILLVEMDAQQKGLGNDDRLGALAALIGFQVRPHITKGVKINDRYAVAMMNQSFVRKELSIPWGDDVTRRKMEPLVTQLRNWRPDIPTRKLRQDAVMALWFCWRAWAQWKEAMNRDGEQDQWRPTWMRKAG